MGSQLEAKKRDDSDNVTVGARMVPVVPPGTEYLIERVRGAVSETWAAARARYPEILTPNQTPSPELGFWLSRPPPVVIMAGTEGCP